MKDEKKTKAELVKELKTLRKERRESALNDLTEHKQADEALRKSEAMYSVLFETAKDAVFLSDETGKFVDVNQMACESLGYSKEELLKLSNKEIDTDPRGYKEFLKIRNGAEEHITFEVNQRRKDGTLLPVEITGSFFTSGGQRISLAIARDITKRKKAEENLKENEEKFHDLFENSNDLVQMVAPDGCFMNVNRTWRETLGYSQKEIAHLSIFDIIHPDSQEHCKKIFHQVMSGKKVKNLEAIFITKDGRNINVEGSASCRFIDGKPVSTRGIIRDITERKKAEENLKNAKDELQMITDSVPALIFYKDIEGRIIRANKTMANSLKMPIKDMKGKAIEELFPKEQAENMRKDDREVIISGKPKRDIIQPYDTPEGTRWSITDKMPYKDKEGKVTGVIAFAKDITVQRKAEQKFQQTFQRLKKAMDATIDTMSKMIEAKDPYTSGHQHRVCQLAVPLAQELGLTEDKIEGIRIASLIHDIGKIGLPTEILSKPTKLTDIEFRLIKGHSQTGYDILKSIEFSYPIAQIVLQHHERLDGSGYPNNLKGDEVSLEARILGVADVVEAMSSHRPYRPALGIDKALEEISKNKGILYDPEVVNACLRFFKEKEFKFEL